MARRPRADGPPRPTDPPLRPSRPCPSAWASPWRCGRISTVAYRPSVAAVCEAITAMASTGVVTALGCHRGRGRGCRADRRSPADGLGPSSYPRARTRRRRNTRARHTYQTAHGRPMARGPIQQSGCERPTRARRGRDLSVRVSELVDRGHCIVHLIAIGASTGWCTGVLPITLPLRRSRVARHRLSASAHRG